MADKFKCKGKHFPKKVCDEWVCMCCDEKVEDPNQCKVVLKVSESKESLCDKCKNLTRVWYLNTVLPKTSSQYCREQMKLIFSPIIVCRFFQLESENKNNNE